MPRVTWLDHAAYLDEYWQPGQHVGVISPTGKGKTTLVVEGLMPFWREANVVLIDLKGDDPSLNKFGFTVKALPGRLERWSQEARHRKRPPWYRLLVPGILSGVSHLKQRSLIIQALSAAHQESRKMAKKGLAGWVVVADETMALVDLRLDPYLRDLWQRGRSRRMTFIALTQEPRWVPRSFYSQPTHLYIGKILDEDDQKRLGEIAGDSKLIRQVVKGLGKHEFLYIGQGGDIMQIVNVRR